MTRLQPWIPYIALAISLWPGVLWAVRRLFYRGRLEVYPTGDLMLGFTDDGRSLILSGTIRALHQDLFVESMYADVYFPGGGQVKPFIWRYSVPDDLSAVALHRARGFNVPRSGAYGFNFYFVDAYSSDATRSMMINLRDELSEQERTMKVFANAAGVELSEKTIVGAVAEDARFLDVARLAGQGVDWTVGEYRIVVAAVLPSGTRFEANRLFELTESDVRALQLDRDRFLRQVMRGERVEMPWRSVRLRDPDRSMVFD